MKNPIEKQDNTVLIVAVTIGAIVAGTLAYLFLTEGGSDVRSSIKHKFKDRAKDMASGIISDKTGIKKKKVKKAADQTLK